MNITKVGAEQSRASITRISHRKAGTLGLSTPSPLKPTKIKVIRMHVFLSIILFSFVCLSIKLREQGIKRIKKRSTILKY